MKLNVVKLGTMEYQSALELQFRLLRLRQQDAIEDTLLLLEHPSVITVGTTGKETNILADAEFLFSKGVTIYHINRGGDVTYHGPGQLVGYPIINLKNHGKDVKDYFRKLENTFIHLLKEEYGLDATRNSEYPGVWVGNEKVTALGCAVKRWVTMHGFAFNVNTDLEHFRWINPCGIKDKGVTSLQKILESPQDMGMVMQQVIRHFSAQYNMETEMICPEGFMQKIELLFNDMEFSRSNENENK